MAYFESTQALIGNTPIVKLSHIDLPDGVNLFAKLELFNPAGSVKDRVGKAMIEDAEQTGILKPGGTFIEATAGNTGLGIAFAALNKGYRIIFVVPTKFSEEKQTLLRALGAEVVNTPREEGMLGASAKAEALRAEIPGAISLGQFVNPANPRVHYETTGPEIYRDLNGKTDFLIAGAGPLQKNVMMPVLTFVFPQKQQRKQWKQSIRMQLSSLPDQGLSFRPLKG